MSEDDAGKFYGEVLKPLNTAQIIKYLLYAVGGVMLLIAIVLIIVVIVRRRRQVCNMPYNVIFSLVFFLALVFSFKPKSKLFIAAEHNHHSS
jgi:hypothetical protein